jgi:putative aldouronate transport system permease protein
MVEKKGSFHFFAHAFMIFLSLCCVFPFFLLIMSSLTQEQSLIRNGYSLFPKDFGLDSYIYMLRNGGRIGRAYGITVFVSAFGTSASLFLTMLTAYPLSRKEFFGRNVISFFIFFTMLFNGGLVPTYIMYTRYLHIRNTVWALIIPALLLNAFYVIMMRTYLSTNIPDAVVEAARIDGAGEWRTLFSIVLPMCTPMIATMALLIGLGYWNDWKNGLYYLTDPNLYSIQNILNRMLQDVQFLKSGAGGAEAGDIIASLPSTGIKMAIAVVGALPVLIVYPFFQKFFVKGITIGSVKG